MPITFRLREILETRADGLTQAELARRTGLSANAVSELAQGKTTRIDFATLESLCRALDVAPGELFALPDAKTDGARRRRPQRSTRASGGAAGARAPRRTAR